MAQLALLHLSLHTTRLALRIARALITQRLAVSVHVSPGQQVVSDAKGGAVKANEQVLLVKTLPAYVARLEEWLERELPGDAPCISRLTAQVNAAFHAKAEAQLQG